MAASTGPGGLNLSSLASQAGAETSTRVSAGQNFMQSALASMLAENQGRLLSQSEQQIREQNFARAQQVLDDALARRLAASQNRGGDGTERDPALDLRMDLMLEQFKTDENIRQQKALMALQAEQEAEVAKDAQFRDKDFGSLAIDPRRGEALLRDRPKSPKGKSGSMGQAVFRAIQSAGYKTSDAERQMALDAIRESTATGTGYQGLLAALRAENRFGPSSSGARRASIALYELGYGLDQG